MDPDRRKHERKSVKNTFVRCYTETWECEGKTLNVSESGISIIVSGSHSVKGKINIAYMENDKELIKTAVPVWYIISKQPVESVTFGFKYI